MSQSCSYIFSQPGLPASVLKWGVKMHSFLHFELTLEVSIGLVKGSLEWLHKRQSYTELEAEHWGVCTRPWFSTQHTKKNKPPQ